MTTVAVPVASKTPTMATAVIFAFVQAIILSVVLMRVRVEPLAATPFVIATAVIVFVSATGAA